MRAFGEISDMARRSSLTKLLSSATTYSDCTPKNLTLSAVSASQNVTLKKVSNAAYSHTLSSQSQSNICSRIVIDTSASPNSGDSPDSERTLLDILDEPPDSERTLLDILDEPWKLHTSSPSMNKRQVSGKRKSAWVFKYKQSKLFSRHSRIFKD